MQCRCACCTPTSARELDTKLARGVLPLGVLSPKWLAEFISRPQQALGELCQAASQQSTSSFAANAVRGAGILSLTQAQASGSRRQGVARRSRQEASKKCACPTTRCCCGNRLLHAGAR